MEFRLPLAFSQTREGLNESTEKYTTGDVRASYNMDSITKSWNIVLPKIKEIELLDKDRKLVDGCYKEN